MARTCGRRLDSNPKPIAGRDRRVGARGAGVVLPDPRAPATTSLHRCYRILLPYTFAQLRMTAFGQAVIDIANDSDYDDWTFSAKIHHALDIELAARAE